MIWHLTVVIFLGRQFDTAPFLEKTILQCSEDNLPVVIFLRRQLSTALFLEKTIVHCTEDNCPLLRRQFYSAKKTMWQWSFLEKTILPKKTILPLFGLMTHTLVKILADKSRDKLSTLQGIWSNFSVICITQYTMLKEVLKEKCTD